jgi:hypothetical protein
MSLQLEHRSLEVASNDIARRRDEIKFLIADDNVLQALKRLLDFVRDFSDDTDHLNEGIVISASYARLEKHERRGTLPFQDVVQQRTQLLYQALALIDGVQQRAGLELHA